MAKVTTEEIAGLQSRCLLPTYAPELALVEGRGCWVWDAEGNKYLDFLSGISVLNVGHCHPRVVKAIRKQAGKLMHCSNLYYNEVQPRLAAALTERALPGSRCFFCNSGAEANEAMMKIARKWGSAEGRYEIITFKNSFHGRTLATLTATGQEKVQKGFEPLPEGFRHAVYNDLESVQEKISEKTVAIMVEPVLGEGGVLPADPDFLKGLEKICQDRNLLLLCDEIQTGMGRTGAWFAYQQAGITPDAISVAKGLGGGFPIGAMVAGAKLDEVFQLGSHGSTFGGNPLACAAALAVIEAIDEEGMLANAREMGDLLVQRLERAVAKCSSVRNIRSQGLMVGVVMNGPAARAAKEMQKRGLLTVATAGNVIRLLPPLNIKPAQVRKAVKIMKKSFEAAESGPIPEPAETPVKEETES
jgi:predicted acetylornithine/succinylornithine family transaminase